MTGQFDFFNEIIVDNFAGGGGASTVVCANLPEWCEVTYIDMLTITQVIVT